MYRYVTRVGRSSPTRLLLGSCPQQSAPVPMPRSKFFASVFAALLPLLSSVAIGQTVPARNAASDQVGATVGEFRVDEAGQATYNIPIYVPPVLALVEN